MVIPNACPQNYVNVYCTQFSSQALMFIVIDFTIDFWAS